MQKPEYTGRFAPSPTGPLHFGSMVTAVASYLSARQAEGKWLIRIDDLDRPRCVKGMDKIILDTLEASGMTWDDAITYQSNNNSLYEQALSSLREHKRVYPCSCTRREIADIAQTGTDGPIYPGTCRNGMPADKTERSTRFISPSQLIKIGDRIQPAMYQNLEKEVGDIVIKRADGLFAYQLAVVVDDHAQGITDIVRGCDLMDSTPRQVCLQQALGYSVPDYAHVPVVTYADGQKLSKQTLARPVNKDRLLSTLINVLEFLKQQPVAELAEGDLGSFWKWAIENWDMRNIPSVRAIRLADGLDY
jgi:glutamyl-Q tRNA(Asp) synthetase